MTGEQRLQHLRVAAAIYGRLCLIVGSALTWGSSGEYRRAVLLARDTAYGRVVELGGR